MNFALVIILVLFIMSAVGVGQSMARMHYGENRRLHLLLYAALTGLFGYWAYSIYREEPYYTESEYSDPNMAQCAEDRARAESQRSDASSDASELEMPSERVSQASSGQYQRFPGTRYDSIDSQL